MSDWGQGVINNDIEWGRGSTNNDIGWGSSYANSWSGDTALELGFEAESLAFFTSIEDAGGTLSDTVKLEYDAFVKREKEASRYSKIKRLYPFLGGVINSARIDAITLNQATNNNFIDADVDATCGLQGDGSTKYIDIGTATDSIFITTNSQFGAFFIGSIPTTFAVHFGYLGATSLVSLQSSTVHRAYNPNVSPFVQATNSGEISPSIICGKFSDTDLKIYLNGSATTQTALNSGSYESINPYIFARNLNPSAASISGSKQGGFFLAEGMTNAEVIAFESSYKTFLTNIGAI